MKKRKFGYKLSRNRGARKALFRSLIKSLVEHGSITTTNIKAKAVSGDIDKLVNLAKKDDLSARRRLYAYLGNDRKSTDLFVTNIATAFKDRVGGYTKVKSVGIRRGDSAKLVKLFWSSEVIATKSTEEKKVSKEKKSAKVKETKKLSKVAKLKKSLTKKK